MGRAVSWNWEVQLSDNPADWIYPSSLGEMGEGEEGRIDVADGDRKYKIRDQIYAVDEVQVTILMRTDRREYNLLRDWSRSGATKAAVYVVAKGAGKDAPASGGTGAGREEMMIFVLKQCQCAMGKKSAFDRQSKAFDTMTFFLIPEDIEELEGDHTIY